LPLFCCLRYPDTVTYTVVLTAFCGYVCRTHRIPGFYLPLLYVGSRCRLPLRCAPTATAVFWIMRLAARYGSVHTVLPPAAYTRTVTPHYRVTPPRYGLLLPTVLRLPFFVAFTLFVSATAFTRYVCCVVACTRPFPCLALPDYVLPVDTHACYRCWTLRLPLPCTFITVLRFTHRLPVLVFTPTCVAVRVSSLFCRYAATAALPLLATTPFYFGFRLYGFVSRLLPRSRLLPLPLPLILLTVCCTLRSRAVVTRSTTHRFGFPLRRLITLPLAVLPRS